MAIFFLWSCKAPITHKQGSQLYENYCSSCHMDNGEGLKNIYPALKGNSLILDDSFSLPCLIRNGHEGRGIGAPMPKFPELSEVEISNIVNFLRYDLNSGKFLSYDELKRQLKTCEQQK